MTVSPKKKSILVSLTSSGITKQAKILRATSQKLLQEEFFLSFPFQKKTPPLPVDYIAREPFGDFETSQLRRIRLEWEDQRYSFLGYVGMKRILKTPRIKIQFVRVDSIRRLRDKV